MILLKAVVGSKLHGLDGPDSDTDYKSIKVSSLKEVISPFRKVKCEDSVSDEKDECVYELTHFCKLAAQCNPTILEVLWSNQIKYFPDKVRDSASRYWEDEVHLAKELVDNKKLFLCDAKKIYWAHRGYAHDQKNKIYKAEHYGRKAKAAVAYCRIMMQGTQLLETGDFNPVLDPDSALTKWLRKVKFEYTDDMLPEIEAEMARLEANLDFAFTHCKIDFKPYIEWIENYLTKVYRTLG